MTGLAILIPIALALGLCGLGAFFWAMHSGQFDDLDGDALRILVDDESPVDLARSTPVAAANALRASPHVFDADQGNAA